MSAHTDSSEHHPHIIPLWIYMAVGGTLLLMTVITVASAQVDLGVTGNLILAMAIATFKASLVAMIFMHLLWDNKLYLVLFISSLLFLTIFIVFTLFDTMHRGRLDPIKDGALNEVATIYAKSGEWKSAHGGHGEETHSAGKRHAHAEKGPWTGAHDDAGTAEAAAAIVAAGGTPGVPSAPVITGDATAGAAKFMTCMACHGPDGMGNPLMKAPAIAGADGWYLKTALQKFLDGVRGGDPTDVFASQMKMMAGTALTSEDDINNVIAHIQTLEAKKPATTISGGDVAAGKAKFVTCAACHGPDGQGNHVMKAPKITHLPDWYIVDQLQKFKSGKRGAHAKDAEGMAMRPMAAMLEEVDMKNLAAYIGTLGAKPEAK